MNEIGVRLMAESVFSRPAPVVDVPSTLDPDQLARAAALLVVGRVAGDLLPEDRVMLSSYIAEGLDGVAAWRMVYSEPDINTPPLRLHQHDDRPEEIAVRAPGPAYHPSEVRRD